MDTNLNEKMAKHHFKQFLKNNRSSFTYWYYHWKAFNLTAKYLGCWKLKYLLHDIEKPWLKLILPYGLVQKLHRENNSHHREYKKGEDFIDFEAMIIDNECSRFTKVEAQLTAKEFLQELINKQKVSTNFADKYIKVLDKLELR